MKTLTWIAIVLTLWVSVDLGERGYAYYQVAEVNRALVEACIQDKLRNLDPASHDSMRRYYRLHNVCKLR